MKKWFLPVLVGLIIIAVVGAGIWLYRNISTWSSYSFGLAGQPKIATIYYPTKYEDNKSDNSKLPDQKIGLFSMANMINFQLSNGAVDKNIQTYVASLARNAPATDSSTPAADFRYKKIKYGFNTAYLINEYNQSPDFVVGDLFDGRGHRLNFTYHTKVDKNKEIKSMISKIKF